MFSEQIMDVYEVNLFVSTSVVFQILIPYLSNVESLDIPGSANHS